MAKVHLLYTIRNYEANNALKFRLESGQRYLRNAIIAIIVAGMLSPLALHSGTTSATSAPLLTTTASSEAGGQLDQ